MPTRPPLHKPFRHARPPSEADRPSASQRGYNARWQAARRQFLSLFPLCCRCELQGRLVSASVVDHVIPHRGDQELFWDRGNWQALCKRCHDSKTAKEDGGGFPRADA